MKFKSDLDAQLFLTEVGAFDLLNEADKEYKPNEELLEEFVKRRSPLVKKIKDHRKSSNQKNNWKKNRHKMMKGIKTFHKSVEGKRFHRKLGRFLATRITRGKKQTSALKKDEEFTLLMQKQEALKGLTSVKQHLFVELEYFHKLDEQVELEEMIIDYAIPLLQSIENSILHNIDLSESEMSFLFDLTKKEVIINELAEKFNSPFEKVEEVWKKVTDKVEESNVDLACESFYSLFIAKLNSVLGKIEIEKQTA